LRTVGIGEAMLHALIIAGDAFWPHRPSEVDRPPELDDWTKTSHPKQIVRRIIVQLARFAGVAV